MLRLQLLRRHRRGPGTGSLKPRAALLGLCALFMFAYFTAAGSRIGQTCSAMPPGQRPPVECSAGHSLRRQVLSRVAATLGVGGVGMLTSSFAARAEEAAGGAPVVAVGRTLLQQRFNETKLEKLPSGYIPSWGPDDLYYPSWMVGRWRVQQTLQGYNAPLGKQFLASGDAKIANDVLDEQQRQLGKPVEFELRYVKTAKNNTVEDRAFNVASRLNAFAGREVVRNVSYADVPGNTRETSLQAGNGPDDPLLTTVVNFKGAVQKIFITAFQTEMDATGDIWRGLASQRTLFAAPGTGANPFAVDEEVITAIRRGPKGIRGRLRLIGFLNPNDVKYFDAGNQAVTIADYSLQYTPLKETDSVELPMDKIAKDTTSTIYR